MSKGQLHDMQRLHDSLGTRTSNHMTVNNEGSTTHHNCEEGRTTAEVSEGIPLQPMGHDHVVSPLLHLSSKLLDYTESRVRITFHQECINGTSEARNYV